MDDNRLKRSFNIEVKDGASEGLRIEGRAIAFETPTLIRGRDRYGEIQEFYEIIDKNSLNKCDLKDVPLRSEHDTKTIYARTRNKSLLLNIMPDGLYIAANLLDNEKSRTLWDEIKSGLIPEMSFSFPVDSKVVNDGKHKGRPLRRVLEIPKLYDVSVCAYGAYGNDTYINARNNARSFDWIAEADQAALTISRNSYSMRLKITEALKKSNAIIGGYKLYE